MEFLYLGSFQTKPVRGFTVLEMIVVTAIIGILSVTVVASERNFDNSTVLINTAYDMALSIRETQTLGLTSRAYSSINNAGYGIHIGDSATSYVEFADIYPAAPGSKYINSISSVTCPGHTSAASLPDSRPGDCYYEASPLSGPTEKVQTYTLQTGYTITTIKYCVMSFGALTCYPVTPSASTFVNIIFERPNSQAVMSYTNGSSIIGIVQAEIEVSSQSGTKRCVVVNNLGQVYVANACP